MVIIRELKNLTEIVSHLYPKRPNMVDIGGLLEDGMREIKIRNCGNYYIIIYEFNIDVSRYQELIEAFSGVQLTSHRWKGVNENYMTITLAQRFNANDLFDEGIMYKPMKSLFEGNDDIN